MMKLNTKDYYIMYYIITIVFSFIYNFKDVSNLIFLYSITFMNIIYIFPVS